MPALNPDPLRADSAFDSGISLLEIMTILLRHRYRLLSWSMLGALLALAILMIRAPRFVSSASFVPQASDAMRSNLANLAGEFGVSLPTSSPESSPDFFASLLTSQRLLDQLARDTVVVLEADSARRAMVDLLSIKKGPQAERIERAITALSKRISVAVNKSTSVVSLSVTTKWPSVSVFIVRQLLAEMTEFNLHSRQSQAGAERQFIAGRLAIADTALRAAEDKMQAFLTSNRQLNNSPALTFERDRLQREITEQQSIYTNLRQAYEDASIREVRNTPVVSIIDQPTVPSQPKSRWLAAGLVVGAMLGFLVSAGSTLIGVGFRRRTEAGDPIALEFTTAFSEAKSGALMLARGVRPPRARGSGHRQDE